MEKSAVLKFDWVKEGFSQSKAKLYSLAINSFHNALNENPDNFEVHNELGLIYFRQEDYEKSICCFEKAISCNPNFFKPYNNLGWVYKKLQQYDEAFHYFTKALQLSPDNIEVLKSISDFYFGLEQYDKAISYLIEAFAITGENEELCFKIALCYEKITNYTDAITFFEKALNFNSKNVACLQELSALYYKINDIEKSKLYLEKFLEFCPNSAWAYSNLGNIYLLYYEEPEIACEYYEKAYELDPNYAYALYNLGNVYSLNKDYDSAIIFYKKACEIENNPVFLNEYAFANYKSDNTDEAIRLLHEVLKLEPENEWANIYMGIIFLEAGSDYEKAVEYFETAKKTNPNNSKTYYYLAKTYLFNFNEKDAIISIDMALRLDADNDKYKALKIRITEKDNNG